MILTEPEVLSGDEDVKRSCWTNTGRAGGRPFMMAPVGFHCTLLSPGSDATSTPLGGAVAHGLGEKKHTKLDLQDARRVTGNPSGQISGL